MCAMAGYQEDPGKYFSFLGILIVFQLICESLGLMCAAATSNATYGILATTTVLMFLLAMGGFITSELPLVFEWTTTINFYRYAFVALLKNELTGLTLVNGDGSTVNGEDTINHQLQTDLSIGQIVGILSMFVVVFRTAGCIALWKQTSKMSWRQMFAGLLEQPTPPPQSTTRASSPPTSSVSAIAELVAIESCSEHDD